MNFGIPVDNNFLRTLPQYRGRSDSELTAKDRSRVAMERLRRYPKDTNDAVNHLNKLKSDYGTGVRCVACQSTRSLP